MSHAGKPDTDQKQFWQMVLETFQSSGHSVRQFCKQEGLSEPSFYAWRKRLTQPQKSDIEKQEGQPEPFIQISMPKETSGGFELYFASGHTLRISPGADRTALSDLISGLAGGKPLLTLPPSVKIFIYTQPTDMRCGFNKRSMLTERFLLQDPFSGHLFVFFNKHGDKCKILFWDRTGFVIWYKRLEEGTFERVPCPAGAASIQVDIAKLTWLLEGIDLFKARRRKRYHRKNT